MVDYKKKYLKYKIKYLNAKKKFKGGKILTSNTTELTENNINKLSMQQIKEIWQEILAKVLNFHREIDYTKISDENKRNATDIQGQILEFKIILKEYNPPFDKKFPYLQNFLKKQKEELLGRVQQEERLLYTKVLDDDESEDD